jgi:hypothetical protein
MIEEQQATEEKVSFKMAVNNIKDSGQELFDTYYKIAIATAAKKGANAAAFGVSGLLLLVSATLMIVFAFTALALWMGTLVNSTAGGFLIVTGILALLMVLVVALKKKVIYPLIRNIIVKKVYEEDND